MPVGEAKPLAPVTQLDRVLASEAGCGRSSRPRGSFCYGGGIINTDIIAIRLHGRGGQGAVTSAELVAQAAIAEGKYAQAFPSFGPERRGAPVLSFVRISDKPIRIRAEVTQPDIVVVLDPSLLRIVKVTAGLKPNGMVVVNAKSVESVPAEIREKYRVAFIDANRIAKETLGAPIVNTTMLGALVKTSGIIKLESVAEPLKHRFGKVAEKNLAAMKRAFDETEVKEAAQA